MIQIAAGAVLAAAVALMAHRTRALTRGGALAAFVVGAIVFGVGGWRGALVLLTFFVPSTLLSRLGRARKRAAMSDAKSGPRDARQVLANGAIAAVCLLLSAWTPAIAVFAVAFAGALAAASADTWGTEIGTLSRETPRSIVTFAPVESGMSGGITLLGSIATLAGAICVAGVAYATSIAAFWPVAIAGIAGAFADSLLGATLQERRWCPNCRQDCESNPHRCGTQTQRRRGFAWLENDAVNFAATLTGALIAIGLAARV